MGKKAPLVIFVYNRVDLTRKMLDAINKNTIANKTDVFIYSDGPKNEKDKQMVSEVRICIHKFSTQNNFKSVKIIESDYNKGLAKSIIEGVTEIIRANNRIIVLEDDLLAADNFLEFMNDCLDFSEKNDKIWSIGGMSFELPAISTYHNDVYACYRGQSCGWATWRDRWDKVDWEVSDYKKFIKDKKRKKQFKRGGEDMVEALKMQMEGKTDSWAIRWCYQESKEDMLTILPVKSLIKNIGWDGRGTHSDVDRFHAKLSEERFEYKLRDVEVDEKLMEEFRKYFYKPIVQKILDFLYTYISGR